MKIRTVLIWDYWPGPLAPWTASSAPEETQDLNVVDAGEPAGVQRTR